MRKLSQILCAIAAIAMIAVSCSKEEGQIAPQGETSQVTFAIDVPVADQTKAIGDGNTVDQVYYEVFYGEGTTNKVAENAAIATMDGKTTVTGGKATLALQLVKNQKYTILFWAQKDGNGVYNPADLTNIAVDYSAVESNKENLDAFYAYQVFTVANANQTIDVTLTRPFAQLNLGTADAAAAEALGVKIANSKVVVNELANAFNVYKGVTSGSAKDVEFKNAAVPTEALLVDADNDGTDETYTYLALNYLLMPVSAQPVVVDVTATFDSNGDDITLPFSSVPVQRNYRTNIVGNLLTSTTNFNIVVDAEFEKPDHNLTSHLPAKITLGSQPITLVNVESLSGTVVEGEGTLILKNVTVNNVNGESAIKLADGAKATIEIVGNVALQGGVNGDGIEVPAGATLKVIGDGNLTVIGNGGADESTKSATKAADNNGGSGIGNAGAAVGSIEIDGLAKLTAKGYGKAAYGIGGSTEVVTIKNTTIEYVSGGYVQPEMVNDPSYGKSEPEGGAAIGADKVVLTNVIINEAHGGSKAAAIGQRFWQSTEVVIDGSTITAFGGNASAAIGGSRYAGDSKHNIKISINNSTINATGGQFAAGIGAGYDTHCNGNKYTAENEIVITGNSKITAQGGKYGAGIGTGYHSAYLSGNIEEGVEVNATPGEGREKYTKPQAIGYGVVDPAREFSGENANITFTVSGIVIAAPTLATADSGIEGVEINMDDEYVIVAEAGWDWFVKKVNSGETFEKKVINLGIDIDLAGKEWTPMGQNASKVFTATFNGAGHTIKNMTVKAGNNNKPSGLFAKARGVIKNLTLENVDITGHYKTGAIIGDAMCGRVENCKVIDGTIKVTPYNSDDANHVGGIAGYLSAEPAAYVKDCSVENLLISAYRDCGGVVGTANGAAVVSGNSATNVNVTANQLVAYKEKKAANAGEIVGRKSSNAQIASDNIATNVTVTVLAPDAEGKVVLPSDTELDNIANVANDDVKEVVLSSDVEGTASTSSGYGAAGVVVDGYTFDGGENVVTVNGANGTWDCAINVKSGTVKNVTAARAFRGIFMSGANGDVYIDNVKFDNVVYTFNSDAGSKEYGVYISNSAMNGWTSHSDVHKEVVYTDCTFGEGSGYAFCRPYGLTKFVNCDFIEGYVVDPRGEAVFVNCRYNGVALTQNNISVLVTNTNEVTVESNSAENFVFNSEQLNAAIANASEGTEIKLVAGNTYEGHFDLTHKNLTIVAEQGATIKGMVWADDCKVTLKGLTLTNPDGVQHPNPQNSQYYNTVNAQYPVIGAYNKADIRMEECTFDLTGPTIYGFYGYAHNTPDFQKCTFNCNGIRPIASNGSAITVNGCTFNDQYHYSVRIFENSDALQTVVYTNNTVQGTNAKGEFEGINISKKGSSATVLGNFTIKGNTAGLKYRHHKNVTMSSSCSYDTDIENFAFEKEN